MTINQSFKHGLWLTHSIRIRRLTGEKTLINSTLDDSHNLNNKSVSSNMAGRYVPPHMRSKVSPTPSNPVANRNPDDGYTLEEIATQFDCKHQPGTLNKVFASDHEFSEAAGKAEQSKDDKDGREILTFILLFKHQHPHWPPKIFCKSHLHLLPSPDLCPPNDANTTEVAEFDEAIHALEPAEKSPLSNPIPVFAEELGKGYQTRFLFFGFHVITSVERLEPKSKELIEMLELKFMPQGKERKPEAWAASLAKK